MTDAELVPHLTIPLSEEWPLDHAWTILRDVDVAMQNPGLDTEPFSEAIFTTVGVVDDLGDRCSA
ncbi:hypothetical protein CJ178_13220 [Rhodococcus sp. ACPA4]|uniref:hypothetical protein n=1 Tax=Rhodococcus sp. ACPA4 TaxID=2028571 RepID=UPI000BB0CC93|nr:hypothetical protein [Rhodococcus sp. ACPA4]PBC42422.1 hypothetical protein CJ178_13220 [Rhodococcus sp. ACPA4]